MDNFKMVKLGEVCEINIGKTPSRDNSLYWGKGFDWVSIADMKSSIITKTKEQITPKAVQECGCKIVPQGTLLLSFKLTIGKLAFTSADVYTNEAIAALPIKDSNLLNAKFLFYALKFVPLNGSNTAVMGQTLNKKSLAEIPLPLPPLPTQVRIARVLSEAEALIQARRESLELLDILAKSVFVEMFGDPVKNERGWGVVELGELFVKEPQNGLYKPSSLYTKNGSRILRIDSFYDGKIYNIEKLKRIEATEDDILKYGLEKNDIVINRVNSIEYLGKCGLVPDLTEPVLFESNMMRFSIDEKMLNPVYIVKLLSSPFVKTQILKYSKKAVNQASINQQDVKKFKILLPPLSLQERFAAIIGQIEAVRAEQEASKLEMEDMYGALMQGAFRAMSLS